MPKQERRSFSAFVEAVKSIPDRKFVPLGDKHWTVPWSPWHAKQVVEKFPPSEWDMDPRVVKEAERYEQLKKLAGATQPADTRVQRSMGRLSGDTLYPFQFVALQYTGSVSGRGILADAQGTGKTVEALAWAGSKGIRRMLVVCPVNVAYKWKRECEKWLPARSVAVVEHEKGELPQTDIHVMSYAIMTARRDELAERKYELFILDEFHAIKNLRLYKKSGPRGSQRALAAFELAQSIPYILCLSGTPMLNRPIELFAVLHMLDAHAWPDRNNFAFRYAGGLYGESEITGQNRGMFQGATHLQELRKRLAQVMIRRTKQQVLPQLPPLTRTILPVDIDRKVYDRVAKEARDAILAISPEHKGYYTTILDKISALRLAVGLAKIKPAVSWVEDFFAESDENVKLVLYCHHREVLEQLRGELGHLGVVYIMGGMAAGARDKALEAFRHDGGPRLMLLTSAGGEGIDLFGLDKTDISAIMMIEREWTPASEEQVESRLHRMGQAHGVNAYYLAARKTVDERMANLVEEKREVIRDAIGMPQVKTFVYRSVVDWLKSVE